jgi:hypothetical protein
MPRRGHPLDGYDTAVPQIIRSSSDSDFLDQLIPVLKDATTSNRTPLLTQCLARYAEAKETEIERIGLTRHEEFLGSVNKLQQVREGTVALTNEILELNQSIQASTEKLAEQKKALVDTRGVRQNLADASEALNESLKILHAVNNSHELIRKKKYYAALKSLEDLQNEHLAPAIQNRFATQHRLADLIQRSIPSSLKAISDAVMADLNTWLYRVRETSQFLGEVAFYNTELRRTRQKKRVDIDPFLSTFKLNSAIELVSDESEEYDVLDNEELQVDFTPLFECLHIHEAIGQSERFRSEYAKTRRQQKDLLVPATVGLNPDEDSSLSSLLESIAGFAIIEKATMRKAPQLRSAVDVEELWDSVCNVAMNLTSKAINDVSDAKTLLETKGVISLFIQTMEGWGYSVSTLDNFLLTLFYKYAELLKKKFSDDFQEVVTIDDYRPMTVTSMEEYENVVKISWFNQERPPEGLTFPVVLPFSKMYPLCCIDVRNFLNEIYFFADDHFNHHGVVDETLRQSLDELLMEKVCQTLVDRLSSQYLGQIVQILTNLEHFEIACKELEVLLKKARASTSAGDPVVLQATESFRNHKKTAERRVFELVNSKIDDLVDTAEYDWVTATIAPEPSSYMQTLTTYLSNIMNSTLLGLPREIKELIYFDALSHASNKLLALPLSPEVKHISPSAVAVFAKDVQYLTEFVGSLENGAMLRENLDELQQTVNLMQSDNHEEFFEISVRNKKYSRVDALNGPILLEKLTPISALGRSVQQLGNLSTRFGINMK